MTDTPELVGPEYLATLLKRKESTIRIDVSRRPETLPPRFVAPGTRGVWWLKEDVLSWFYSLRPQIKRKVGRPSGQTI